MADITMCKGLGCNKKRECYRFTAKPNEFRQAYFTGTPWFMTSTGKLRCDWFDPIDNDPVSLSHLE